MTLLTAILGSGLGVLLSALYRTKSYVADGTFSISKFTKENQYKVAWAGVLGFLLQLTFYYYPDSVDVINFIGINVDLASDITSNLSPVLIGILLYNAVYKKPTPSK